MLDVHGIDETKAFLDGAFADELRDGVGDVEIIAPMRRFEPEMFSERFHPDVFINPIGTKLEKEVFSG